MSKKRKLDPCVESVAAGGGDSPSSMSSLYSSDSNSLGLGSQDRPDGLLRALTNSLHDILTFLVWPSHFFKLSCFRELIYTTVFAPRIGVSVVVKLVEDHPIQEIPIPTCPDCTQLKETSQIVKCIGDVKWGLVYLLGAHMKRIQAKCSNKPSPILGIFMDGDNVCVCA